jgi:diguanylate cyclase (GGDEF)-like protein
VSYPFDFSLLSNTFFFLLLMGIITYFLAKKFIFELRKKIKELFFLSQRDVLTGLKNRRSVISTLDYYNSAILFDVDDFKKINDTFGHYCGDEILVDLSSRITQVVRDNDALVRWGGEEFVVLMKADKIESCVAVAKRIQNSMEKSFLVKDRQLNVTCSIGVAFSSEKSHINMKKVIANADLAMYEAKTNGKIKLKFMKLIEMNLKFSGSNPIVLTRRTNTSSYFIQIIRNTYGVSNV